MRKAFDLTAAAVSAAFLFSGCLSDKPASAGSGNETVTSDMTNYSSSELSDEAVTEVNSGEAISPVYGSEQYSFLFNSDICSTSSLNILTEHFYGTWEAEDGSETLILNNTTSPFDFEGFVCPYGPSETDKAYIFPFINGSEPSCYVIKKDEPDVLYHGLWNGGSISGDDNEPDLAVTDPSGAGTRYKLGERALPMLSYGRIGVLGQCNLLAGHSSEFVDFFNETVAHDISEGFIDEMGQTWVINSSAMLAGAPRYLVSNTENICTVGIEYFRREEYRTLEGSGEKPESKYFALRFFKDENERPAVTYLELDSVYWEADKKTYMGETPDYYEGLLPELELQNAFRAGGSLSFRSAVVALRAPDGEIKASCPIASGMAGSNGFGCTALREPLVKLFNLENRRILVAVGLPLWESEFDRRYLATFYLYDGEKLSYIRQNGGVFEEFLFNGDSIDCDDNILYLQTDDSTVISYELTGTSVRASETHRALRCCNEP